MWLPCTLHCSLAAAGIPLADCCEGATAGEKSPDSPASDPCRDCPTCSAVESGGYVKQDQAVDVKPVLTVAWLWDWLESLTPPVSADVSSLRTISPPELPPSWRFVERAALPPRAPACLS